MTHSDPGDQFVQREDKAVYETQEPVLYSVADGVATLTMGTGSVLRFSRTDTAMAPLTAAITSAATSRIEQNGTGRTEIFGGSLFTGEVVVNAGELVAANAAAFGGATVTRVDFLVGVTVEVFCLQ